MCDLLGAMQRMLTDSLGEFKLIRIIADSWSVQGTFAKKLCNVATP